MRRRTLTGVALGALGAGLAPAADADAQTQPGTSYWSGGYAGLQLGYGGVNTDGVFDNSNQAPDLAGIARNGMLGGGQIGWNLQSGDWVFGAEADLAAVDWDGDVEDKVGDVDELDTDVLATVRGRAGPVFGDSLVYGTAGLAIMDVGFTADPGGLSGHKDTVALGGAFGAGIETIIDEGVSFKVEGLYLLFDESMDLGGVSGGSAGDHLEVEDGFVLRAGLNLHFSGGLPGGPGGEALPPADWSGPYVGVSGGYGGLNAEGLFDDGVADLGGVVRNGAAGGALAGWNLQWGAWVAGLEGDVSFVDWDGTVGPDREGDRHATDTDLLATARARIGIASGDTLIYGTAGAAFIDAELETNRPEDPGRKDLSAFGATGGAGIEVKLLESLSVRVEGLYFAFDDDTDLSSLPDAEPDDSLEIQDGFLFRAGVSLHL